MLVPLALFMRVLLLMLFAVLVPGWGPHRGLAGMPAW